MSIDLTNDRLDALEARARDTDRQLRTVRSCNSEMIADMAAKLGEIVERLDGTDRRVEALRQGLNDVVIALGKHENQLSGNGIEGFGKRIGLIERIDNIQDRVNALQTSTYLPQGRLEKDRSDRNAIWQRVSGIAADLARIEDMLTAEKPAVAGTVKGCECHVCQMLRAEAAKPPRKSLGWINVIVNYPSIRGHFVVLHPTREQADKMASTSRIACVEIFEGEGL